MMDDDKQKRPLDPSDFEDDLYDDEFAFDEHDPEMPLPAGTAAPAGVGLDSPEIASEFEDTPENWGDFEDPALTAVKPGQVPPTESAARKKSFFMKHFNTIVIAAGVVLGVIVVGTQLLGPAPNSSTLPDDMPPMETAETPPQPSPIAPAEPQISAQASQTDKEKLTPMPDAQATGQAPANGLPPLNPGPDLGLDKVGVKEGPQDAAPPADQAPTQAAQLEDPAPPAPIEGATNVDKPAVELPDPIAFENQPIPTAAAEPALAAVSNTAPVPATEPATASATEPAKALSPADPPQMAASIETAPTPAPTATPTPAGVTSAPEAPDTPTKTPTEATPSPSETAPTAVAASSSNAPAAEPAADPAQNQKLEELTAEKETLSARNKDLESEISGANAKIDQLSSMLADMQKKIEALEKTPKAEEASASSDSSEPAKDVAAPEPSAPAEKANILVPAKPTNRPETPPAAKKKSPPASPRIATSSSEDTPRWVLRSAQNGRAVVSDRSTGDLRSIQVGDTLRGIGKIQSISSQNGRWLVQGSQGQVKQ